VHVAHDGFAGPVQHPLAVGRVLRVLPVPAGDVGPELVRQRGDQRRHHQQRVGVVVRPVVHRQLILRGRVPGMRHNGRLRRVNRAGQPGAVAHHGGEWQW
jgi:hypothetical protein